MVALVGGVVVYRRMCQVRSRFRRQSPPSTRRFCHAQVESTVVANAMPCAASAGQAVNELRQWLQTKGYGDYADAIVKDCGCASIADTKYLREDDLKEIGMKGVPARKLLEEAEAERVAAKGVAASAPSTEAVVPPKPGKGEGSQPKQVKGEKEDRAGSRSRGSPRKARSPGIRMPWSRRPKAEDVDEMVQKCIDTFVFEGLADLLTESKPPPRDTLGTTRFDNTVARIRQAVEAMCQGATESVADAPAVMDAWRRMQSASQDIGAFMQEHDTDVAGMVSGIEDEVAAHAQRLVAVVQEQLDAKPVNYAQLQLDYDAAAHYCEAARELLVRSPGEWPPNELALRVKEKLAEVDDLIEAFVRERKGAQALHEVLNSAQQLQQRQQQQSPQSQLQCYAHWQQLLGTKLDQLNRDLVVRVDNSQEYYLAEEIYSDLQREWEGGLKHHIENLSFDIAQALRDAREKKDAQSKDLNSWLLSGDSGLDKLEACLKQSPEYSHYCEEFQGLIVGHLDTVEQAIRSNSWKGSLASFRALCMVQCRHQLHEHLEGGEVRRLAEVEKSCNVRASGLCEDVCQQFEDKQFGSCGATLKQLGEHLREDLPADPAGLHVVHITVLKYLTAELKALDASCKRLDFRQAHTTIGHLRTMAQVFTGPFAVYVEDSRQLTEADSKLGEILSLVKDRVTSGDELLELGRDVALLELSAPLSSQKVEGQREALAASCNSDQWGGRLLQRTNAAADRLEKIGDLSKYDARLRSLFSDRVRNMLQAQQAKVKQLLSRQDQKLYEDVRKMVLSKDDLVLAAELVKDSPPVHADDEAKKLRDEVTRHANEVGLKADKALDDRDYRKLQIHYAALESIASNFSVGFDEMHPRVMEVRRRTRAAILDSMRDLAAEARVTLQSDRSDQLRDFARNLIELGRFWFELPDFKAAAERHINELLNTCQEDEAKGPQYLKNLGKILSGQPAQGELSPADPLHVHSAIGNHIVQEFPHFKMVNVALWNQTVKKTQLAPESCARSMQTKMLETGQAEGLNQDELLEALGTFDQLFKGNLQAWIDGTLQKEQLVEAAKQKVKSVRQAWSRKLDMGAVKQCSPELLADIFLYYTIASSGDNYMSLKQQKDSGESLVDTLITPHNIQVLALLRMLGFGSNGLPESHLLQIRTGEGKSLVLGAAATLFALVGCNVRCVCYSDYLSQRDYGIFRSTFSAFGVEGSVKYSKITDYSEDKTAAQGDIRSLTLSLLTKNNNQGGWHGLVGGFKSGSSPASRAEEVLLIDEVDVLFGSEFYGKTHDQFAKLEDENVKGILEALWHKRDEASDEAGASALCAEMKSTAHYQSLLSKYQGFEYLIESQIGLMCMHLVDYMRNDRREPVVGGGKIGYKIMDGVSYEVVDGYKTAFAYLEHVASSRDSQEILNRALTLLVPCGQFSYADINPDYVFGVSGTVDQLDDPQRLAIKQYGLRCYTIMPTVYGETNCKFLERHDAIVLVEDDEALHLQMARQVEDMIKSKRAVIVFFKDYEKLRRFQESSYCDSLPNPNVLQEALSDDMKEQYIKKAATVGQVTLATAIFGRGCDFACFDDALHQCGGMHVIQTFLSMEESEEVQIRGRTARQGKNGSYGMILNRGELPEGVPIDVDKDGQNECYQRLKQACKEESRASFEAVRGALEEANRKGSDTKKYLDALVRCDQKLAATFLKQVYDNAVQTVGSGELTIPSTHYVLCLDMSSSMEGCKFEQARHAAISFVDRAADLHKDGQSKVSVIMFNQEADLVVTEESLDHLDQISARIAYAGGGTSFSAPLQTVIELVTKCQPHYQRQCIIFYTDGEAPKPTGEARQLRQLMDSNPRHIEFFAICEEADPRVLQAVCQNLYPHPECAEHCLQDVKPEHIRGKMQEVLTRMSMGYVRDSSSN